MGSSSIVLLLAFYNEYPDTLVSLSFAILSLSELFCPLCHALIEVQMCCWPYILGRCADSHTGTPVEPIIFPPPFSAIHSPGIFHHSSSRLLSICNFEYSIAPLTEHD